MTTDDDEEPIRRLCFSLGVEDIHLLCPDDLYEPRNGAHFVFLNGLILGVHRQPQRLLATVRQLRRAGHVGEFVSVQLHPTHRSINIASDSGRVCRPLIIVERARSKPTPAHLAELEAGRREWGDFIKEGIIEYLDVNEENSAEIAISEAELRGKRGAAYTHLEIDPLTILGVCAGLIPYPHHNQSPRNTYQCAMGKQAMGTIAHNQGDRIDTILYLLVYPHKPLVKTRTLDLIVGNLPAGHNATVAVVLLGLRHRGRAHPQPGEPRPRLRPAWCSSSPRRSRSSPTARPSASRRRRARGPAAPPPPAGGGATSRSTPAAC